VVEKWQSNDACHPFERFEALSNKTSIKSTGGIMALPKKIKELIPYYSYNIHYSDEDKAYIVSVDELTGCMTHGDSAAEALEMAHEAVEGHLEVLLSQKQEIPEPISKIKASGDFLVRSNPELHQKLIRKSHQEGYKSLNKFVVDKLEEIVEK
jgi:predicted RNase H-like HicB family nuclease